MGSSISECGHIHCCKYVFQSKVNNKMANSIDPAETALYKPFSLDLYCLLSSVGLK